MTKPLVTMEEYRQQHLYFVEGDPNVDPLIPLPSVTKVNGYVDPPGDGLIYWGINQYIESVEEGRPLRGAFTESRKESAGIGTQLHAEIEHFIKEKQWPDNPSRPFSNWYAAMNERVSEWIEAEQKVYHGRLRYGGTADSIAIMDGKRTLFDWKTANLLEKNTVNGKLKRKEAKDIGYLAAASQIGGYLLALQYQKEPKIEQAFVVYVARDTNSVELKQVDMNAAKKMFIASLRVYRALHTGWIKSKPKANSKPSDVDEKVRGMFGKTNPWIEEEESE
tara:strand:+ start:417 stop:1250 length:834 start_codon:yes stop_codon:yes gene_type:complete